MWGGGARGLSGLYTSRSRDVSNIAQYQTRDNFRTKDAAQKTQCESDINIFCNLQEYIFGWRSPVSIDTAEDRHRPGPADAYKRRLRAHDNVGRLHVASRRKHSCSIENS